MANGFPFSTEMKHTHSIALKHVWESLSRVNVLHLQSYKRGGGRAWSIARLALLALLAAGWVTGYLHPNPARADDPLPYDEYRALIAQARQDALAAQPDTCTETLNRIAGELEAVTAVLMPDGSVMAVQHCCGMDAALRSEPCDPLRAEAFLRGLCPDCDVSTGSPGISPGGQAVGGGDQPAGENQPGGQGGAGDESGTLDGQGQPTGGEGQPGDGGQPGGQTTGGEGQPGDGQPGDQAAGDDGQPGGQSAEDGEQPGDQATSDGDQPGGQSAGDEGQPGGNDQPENGNQAGDEAGEQTDGQADNQADQAADGSDEEQLGGEDQPTQPDQPAPTSQDAEAEEGQKWWQVIPLWAWLLLVAGPLFLVIGVVIVLRGQRAAREVEAETEEEIDAPTPSAAVDRARQLFAAGNYREAVRYLFLAALRVLDEREVLRFEQALTNRELLGRARSNIALATTLSPVVATFDRVWYGFEPLTAADYDLLVKQVERLKQF